MRYIIYRIFLKLLPCLKKQKTGKSISAIHSFQLEERACHFDQLFISHNGDVFPCCLRWMAPKMKIGHIDDNNLLNAIRNFYSDCHCQRFKLRKGSPKENINITSINIELSLECQGSCALCCVEAPSWKGVYDYYDSLTKVINLLKPSRILVQGGEVLVQKKSLEWLEQTKAIHPSLEISIVTNGNVNLNLVDKIEELANEVTISFMAFEPGTYESIMGMNFKKTVAFAKELARRKKVRLILKYLTTPLSVHEANIFLEWAINLNPFYSFFEDANTLSYVNIDTNDKFWEKIFERTGQKVKAVLVNNKDKLLETSTTVRFSPETIQILGLSSQWNDFLEKNELQKKVLIY